ncbi:MAG: AsmA-like C-terminal region-containing protein, partial [Planctomycetota bacterium]
SYWTTTWRFEEIDLDTLQRRLEWIGIDVPVRAQEDPRKAGPAKISYWTTTWRFEEIDLDTLQRRLEWIGIDVPVRASGRATVDLELSVPLNRLRQPKAYRGSGKLKLIDVAVDEVPFKSLEAELELRDGVATLHQLSVQQGDGRLNGSAEVDLGSSPQPFRVQAELSRWNIEPVANLLRKLGIGGDRQITGVIDGQLEWKGKLESLDDPSSYEADGQVVLSALRIGESAPWKIAIRQFTMSAGEAVLRSLRINSDAHPTFFANADARLVLGDETSLIASGVANDVPCSEVLSLIGPGTSDWIEGKIDFRGEVRVDLDRERGLKLAANAAIASPSMRVFGLDCGLIEHDLAMTEQTLAMTPREPESATTAGLLIEGLRCRYEIESDETSVDQLELRAFGGELNGELKISNGDIGEHQVSLRWRGIRPRIRLNRTANSVVTGTLDGTVEWTVPSAHVSNPSFHRGTVRAECQDLRVGTDSIGSLAITMKSEPSLLQAQLNGKVFGGEISIEAQARTGPDLTWADVPARASIGPIRMKDLSLRDLLSISTGEPSRYEAKIGGEIQLAAGDLQSATIKATLSGLRNRTKLIADGIEVDVAVRGDTIVVERVRGRLAKGVVVGNGQWSLSGGKRALRLRLIRADAGRSLRVVSTQYDDLIQGGLSTDLRIVGGGKQAFGTLLVSGSFEVHDGVLAGVPLGESHGPVLASIDLNSFRWKAHLPRLQSRFAHGKISGDLRLRSAAGSPSSVQMESSWRVSHVDFQRLLSQYAGTTTLGRGDLSGKLQLSGRDISSVSDIRGDFRFQLSGTDAAAVPGLSRAGALLGASALVGVRFERGEVVGSVSRGSLILKTFQMLSDRVVVSGSGRVGLLDNRMDVNATLLTGDFHGQNAILGTFGRNVVLQAIPIVEINRLLSNRAVVVDLGGTLQSPVVQLLPGETLRVNSGRFLTEEAVGLILADSWLDP